MTGIEPEEDLKRQRVGVLLLAFVLVFSSHGLPTYLATVFRGSELETAIGYSNFHSLWFLLFSTLLVVNDPVGFGLRIGDIKDQWPWILLICVVPIVATGIIYPMLPVKPFAGKPVNVWLISPLAQDLLFCGFLYRKFEIHFPGVVSKRFPLKKTIVITAAFFSLWHTTNFFTFPPEYVWFQLVYTFVGACVMGVTRQLTGSIIYIVLVHMSVNWIAVNF